MSEVRKQMLLQKQRRNRAIEHLVKESIINILAEQDLNLSSVPPAPTTAAPQSQPAAPTKTPSAAPPAQPEQTVPKQYTVDDMIRELNAIRSGRSFTDPEIYGRLVTFFKGLSDEQKVSLDDLLTKIAELVTSVDDSFGAQPQQTSTSGQAQTQPPAESPQQSAPMPGAQAGGSVAPAV